LARSRISTKLTRRTENVTTPGSFSSVTLDRVFVQKSIETRIDDLTSTLTSTTLCSTEFSFMYFDRSLGFTNTLFVFVCQLRSWVKGEGVCVTLQTAIDILGRIRSCLQFIHSNSSYKSLRGVIDLSFALAGTSLSCAQEQIGCCHIIFFFLSLLGRRNSR
jgi:hypothetical protein